MRAARACACLQTDRVPVFLLEEEAHASMPIVGGASSDELALSVQDLKLPAIALALRWCAVERAVRGLRRVSAEHTQHARRARAPPRPKNAARHEGGRDASRPSVRVGGQSRRHTCIGPELPWPGAWKKGWPGNDCMPWAIGTGVALPLRPGTCSLGIPAPMRWRCVSRRFPAGPEQHQAGTGESGRGALHEPCAGARTLTGCAPAMWWFMATGGCCIAVLPFKRPRPDRETPSSSCNPLVSGKRVLHSVCHRPLLPDAQNGHRISNAGVMSPQ